MANAGKLSGELVARFSDTADDTDICSQSLNCLMTFSSRSYNYSTKLPKIVTPNFIANQTKYHHCTPKVSNLGL